MIALIAALAMAPMQADGDQILPPAGPGVVAKGAALHSVEWHQHEIPVCWVDPDPADSAARALVRQMTQQTWEAVADVRFTGWEACSGARKMVRIRVGDGEWPHAVLGTLALSHATPTVFLNFHLARHPGFAGCAGREERCLRFTAVHEFGHVLGLIHEQDRPETPAQCIAGLAPGQRAHQDAGDLDMLTGYDADSLMNYCSARGYDPKVPLALSDEDIVAARKLFGPAHPVTAHPQYPRFDPN